MSLVPEVASPYLGAFLLGVVNGLFFCTSSCLPYIAGYIAGINAGFRRGVGVTVIFNSGRVVAYALIGALVGALKLVLDEAFIAGFQTYSAYIFGTATMIIGATLLVRKQPDCNCSTQTAPTSARFRDRFDVRAFILGLSRGLILCSPLLFVLGYSLTFASPLDSFVLAVLFGFGTALSPIVLIGGATGWLLNKAPLFRKWISIFGAVALIVLGLVTLLNTIII